MRNVLGNHVANVVDSWRDDVGCFPHTSQHWTPHLVGKELNPSTHGVLINTTSSNLAVRVVAGGFGMTGGRSGRRGSRLLQASLCAVY